MFLYILLCYAYSSVIMYANDIIRVLKCIITNCLKVYVIFIYMLLKFSKLVPPKSVRTYNTIFSLFLKLIVIPVGFFGPLFVEKETSYRLAKNQPFLANFVSLALCQQQ